MNCRIGHDVSMVIALRVVSLHQKELTERCTMPLDLFGTRTQDRIAA